MDVAGAVLDGLGEDQVDELDNGSVARVVQQVGRLLDLGDDAVGRIAVHDLDEFLRRITAQVIGRIDGGEDRPFGGQHHFGVVAAEQPHQIVDGLEVGGVVHSDQEGLGRLHGDHLLLLEVLDWDLPGKFHAHVIRGEFRQEGDPELEAQAAELAYLVGGLLVSVDLPDGPASRRSALGHGTKGLVEKLDDGLSVGVDQAGDIRGPGITLVFFRFHPLSPDPGYWSFLSAAPGICGP